MATQALTIQLRLSGLTRVTAGLGQLGGAARSAVAGVSAAVAGIGAIATAVAGSAVTRVIADSVERMDKLSKAAQKVGASAEDLSALGYAAKLNDLELENLQEGLKRLNDWYGRTGQSIGSFQEALLQQADLFSRMQDGPEKAALAVERFGKSGMDMIPFLNQGRAGIAKLTEEAKRLGVVVSTEDAQAAEKLNDQLTSLKSAAEGLANKVTVALVPSLTELAKVVTGIVASLPLDKLQSGLKAAATGFAVGPGGAWIQQVEWVRQFAASLAGGAGIGQSMADASEAARIAYQKMVASLFEEKPKQEEVKRSVVEFTAALRDQEKAAKLVAEGLTVRRNLIEGDPGIADSEKRLRLRKLNAEAMENLARRERELQSRAPANAQFTDETGTLRFSEEGLKWKEEAMGLSRERADLLNERDRLGSSDSQMNWRDASVSIQNQFDELGNMARLTAQSFQSVFSTAIESVSGGIQRLIGDTEYWSSRLGRIAGPIMGSLTAAISRMFTEWIVKRTVMAAKNIALAVSEGSAETAAKAPGAVLTSISSYGAAAVIGLAAVVAAMAAFGGFAEGGYTGSLATNKVAGVVHGQEFVFDAPAVQRIGVSNLEAIRSGDLAPAQAVGSKGSQSTNIHLAAFDSRLDARRWADSQDGETWFVDMAKRTAHKWRRS